MKILNRKIKVSEFLTLIENRMANVTIKYQHAVADKDKVSAESLAETKWQLAELKMQLCDYLVENIKDAENE